MTSEYKEHESNVTRRLDRKLGEFRKSFEERRRAMLVDEAREFESSLRQRLNELEQGADDQIRRIDEEEQKASVQRRLASKAWEAREVERQQSKLRSDSRTVKPFWKKAGELFSPFNQEPVTKSEVSGSGEPAGDDKKKTGRKQQVGKNG